MNANIWNIYFELPMKDKIEERSSQLVRNLSSCFPLEEAKTKIIIGI